MKNFIVSFKYSLTAFAVVTLASISTVVFSEADESVKDENVQASSECQMKAYTDPEVMAATIADPTKFMELMMLMSNPQTSINMMNCGMDPNQWNEIIANMMDTTKMMNGMAQFMNPQMYMNWMTASMNPAYYTPLMNTYMNPAYYMQWMTVSMNPATYMQPMTQVMDPAWQQQSAAWMMNPATYQKMFESMYQNAPVVAEVDVKE